ncbi:MAG: hypothetical protein ACTSVI_04095 [Promethearchaeota archaeon]
MGFKTLIVKDFDTGTFEWTDTITDGDIAYLIDNSSKIIYVWHGNRASMIKKYKAGTLATKIKSQYQFYGYKTEVINQGEETGELLDEINNLLDGKGHLPSDDELEALKPVEVDKTLTPTAAVKEKKVVEPKIDQVKELEEELEKEKKKSAHKIAKLKEEMDNQKIELEKRISNLEAELKEKSKIPDLREDVVKKDKIIDDLKSKVDKIDKESKSKISKLEKDLSDANEKIKSLSKELESKPKIDESTLKGLEKENEDLKKTINTLQKDIAKLKDDLEKSKNTAVDSKELDKIKKDLEAEKKKSEEKIGKLRKELEDMKKKYEDEIDDLKKKHEDEIAKLKEDAEKTSRKLIEAEQKLKDLETLDFVDVSAMDENNNSKDSSGLTFVNPYSSGEPGVKVDPLNDLKSFLNTVDPSKPIDPQLKNLLETISEQMQSDETILKSLENIKKGIKDKKLSTLIEDTIKKVKEKIK